MIIIYCTVKDLEEGKKISRILLEKKLIACANILPINSMYWWKGKIQEDSEYIVLLKTKSDKYEQIEKEIKKVHSYDTPAIYSWKIDKGNKDYLDWVNDEVS